MRERSNYILPIKCAASCQRHDLGQILCLGYRIVVTMPPGWRRDEASGYMLCPDHANCEIVYFDDDSVFVQPATHHESKVTP
jgi:hypothetical protein